MPKTMAGKRLLKAFTYTIAGVETGGTLVGGERLDEMLDTIETEAFDMACSKLAERDQHYAEWLRAWWRGEVDAAL